MDNEIDECQSDDIAISEIKSEGLHNEQIASNLEQTPSFESSSSVFESTASNHIPINNNNDNTENVKKRTVKEILDEVLNCTVIQVPNNQENNENNENPNRLDENSKVVTVKEILGEILQYNVCKLSSSTSLETYGWTSQSFILPSTSRGQEDVAQAQSDLNISLKGYTINRQLKVNVLKVLDSNLKTETVLPKTVNRLLPTYSSVMRQGPQPKVKKIDSFVPKIPPPSYAEVQGIWDDLPSGVSSDSVVFGPDPLYLICPVCRVIVTTQIERERTTLTHWIAFVLCIFMCWPCCLLPYYLKSCSYTYHSCPNCGHYFGMYNPF